MAQEQNWEERIEAWPKALGSTTVHAYIRRRPEDFQVQEKPSFEPTGEGQHHYLLIEKRSQNTRWVAQQLAEFSGLRADQIGYAGMKDRHALTRQWFSIPDETPLDLSRFHAEGVQILSQQKSHKKIRIGELEANHFKIRLTECRGERQLVEERLKLIVREGVPNYYGRQRFGHHGQNIEHAQRMFSQRRTKQTPKWRLYLSAARAFLFNEVLAEYIRLEKWPAIVAPAASLMEKTGPLWGRGRADVAEITREMEERIAYQYPVLKDGLEHVGLRQDRRALVLSVERLQWQWAEEDLLLNFTLPRSGYALSVLRELGAFKDVSLDTDNIVAREK